MGGGDDFLDNLEKKMFYWGHKYRLEKKCEHDIVNLRELIVKHCKCDKLKDRTGQCDICQDLNLHILQPVFLNTLLADNKHHRNLAGRIGPVIKCDRGLATVQLKHPPKDDEDEAKGENIETHKDIPVRFLTRVAPRLQKEDLVKLMGAKGEPIAADERLVGQISLILGCHNNLLFMIIFDAISKYFHFF